jgi:adenosylcobinamide kinase/adenosylcobinamide-phosphate guanylyltransferase
MLILILGGSGSGKSEFGENLALKLGKEKLYIATMKPFGQESLDRIKKHREMRKKKEFETYEIYKDFTNINIEKSRECDVILVECISNILANEMFSENTVSENVVDDILNGIKKILLKSKNTIIISNDINFDGNTYSKEVIEYQKKIGEINRKIAVEAELVIEVVAGIPIYHKGEDLC